MRYSQSGLALFDQCPALYKARRLDHIGEQRSKALAVGRFAHDVIHSYLRLLMQEKRAQALEEVPALIRACAEGESTKEYPVAFSADVAPILAGFARRFSIPPERFVELEGYFEVPFNGDSVHGYIDLAYLDDDGALGVRDFKTGWAVDQRDEWLVFQLLVYMWALARRYPKRRIFAEAHFVRPDVVTQRLFLTPALLEELEGRLSSLIARVKAEQAFAPVPGKWCSYCPIATTCSVRRNLSQDCQVQSRVEAEAALRDLLVLEAAIEARRGSLAAWAEANGPVELNGVRAAYSARESIVLRDVARLIERLGLGNALNYLSIDNRSTQNLKNDPRLDGLWKAERKSEFRVEAVK